MILGLMSQNTSIACCHVTSFHCITRYMVTILPVRFSRSTLLTVAPKSMPEPSGTGSGWMEMVDMFMCLESFQDKAGSEGRFQRSCLMLEVGVIDE